MSQDSNSSKWEKTDVFISDSSKPLNEQITIEGLQHSYIFDIKNTMATLINGVGSHAIGFPSKDKTPPRIEENGMIRENVDENGIYKNEKYALIQRLQMENEKDKGFIDEFYNAYAKTKNVYLFRAYEKIKEVKREREAMKFRQEAYKLSKLDEELEKEHVKEVLSEEVVFPAEIEESSAPKEETLEDITSKFTKDEESPIDIEEDPNQ